MINDGHIQKSGFCMERMGEAMDSISDCGYNFPHDLLFHVFHLPLLVSFQRSFGISRGAECRGAWLALSQPWNKVTDMNGGV